MLSHAQILTNSIGMQFAPIPAGSFLMGSPKDERQRSEDEVQHLVILSNPFLLGRTVVTESQWKQVMHTAPWRKFWRDDFGDDYPAVYISWDDAADFCSRLTALEGCVYRLPTEAEWEYACRAGTGSAYCCGDEQAVLVDFAAFYGAPSWHADRTMLRAAQKQANAWGLYDMHGNVWEWCSDWYGVYETGEVVDPAGPVTGDLRVSRGGAFTLEAGRCRSAIRNAFRPAVRDHDVGFRVVKATR